MDSNGANAKERRAAVSEWLAAFVETLVGQCGLGYEGKVKEPLFIFILGKRPV